MYRGAPAWDGVASERGGGRMAGAGEEEGGVLMGGYREPRARGCWILHLMRRCLKQAGRAEISYFVKVRQSRRDFDWIRGGRVGR